ncbi:MAG: ABC transporter permease subunit [Melioribacteraceae bacterium]
MISRNYFLKNNSAKILPLLAKVAFVYIILFEFILPANGILPKPSILIESVTSLFKHYNFLYAFGFTLSIIFFALLVGYFLIRIFRNTMLYFTRTFPTLISLLDTTKYFLMILLVFIFHFWFGNNIYGELFLAIIVVLGNLKIEYFKSANEVKQEYLDAAQSLNISESKKTNVIWKSVQPKLFSSLEFSHYSLWTLLIIYEYINGTNGIGSVFRLAIKYNDFSVVVLLILIISTSLWLSTLLLNSIRAKFFFWNS